MEVSMTIAELYNVLEKAIDSGKATIYSGSFYLCRRLDGKYVLYNIDEVTIDSDGDLIFSENGVQRNDSR